MVFKATFNNISLLRYTDSDYPFVIFKFFSYIMAVSLLMEETGVPGENHRPAVIYSKEYLTDEYNM